MTCELATAYIIKEWGLDVSTITPVRAAGRTRVDLAKLFAELDYRTGAEIGTYSGSFAITMSINVPKLKLYCVDAWATYDGLNDYTDADYMEEIYQLARRRLGAYKGIEIMRELSMDAVKKFDDESLDFVYIDANHEFPYVAEDLYYWAKKVRPGGIVSGHDYLKTPREDNLIQVREVVRGYTEAFNVKPWFVVDECTLDKDWLILLGEAMSRGKVSVIIPARKELYIRETLKDVMSNAVGDIEVILVLDGDIPDYELPEDKRLRVYHNSKPMGLRPCLNAAIDVARGKYLLKIDAHCTIGEGWDKVLKADCEDNWIVIPRRYWFDAPTWKIKDRPLVDAMAYVYPFKPVYKPRLTARPWPEYAEQHKDEMLVEDMSYQGSAWFMHREHWHRIGGMPATDGYGTFGEEPQELGLKTQLGPWEGKVMRNKNTWYAHWSKPMEHWRTDPEVAGRVTTEEFYAANDWAFDYWWNNRWDKQVHDFQWLVDKFWPLPKWPENWRWLVTQYDRYEFPVPPGVYYPAIDENEFQLVTR